MKNNLQFYRCILEAGQVVFSGRPSLLSSVCGSGVVVTLWDRIKRSGGMAHCIFPERRLQQRPTNYHADIAIPLLIREFLNRTNYAFGLEAQIFGGGSLREVSLNTASKTVKAARRILRKFNIPVTSEDTGGGVGRKIIFNTFSGDVIVLKTKKIRLTDWAPDYKIACYI